MPKYNWEDYEEFEEEAFQEKIQTKKKPKRKKKSYDEFNKTQNTRFNKKHPNRR